MEYTTLGSTGMKVSKICLGCTSFGPKDWYEWVLEEEESREIIEGAIDLGIKASDGRAPRLSPFDTGSWSQHLPPLC